MSASTCICGASCRDRGNGHADFCEDCAHRWIEEQGTRIEAQDARIRELEGALAEFVATDDEMPVIPWSNDSQAKWFDRLYTASCHARRILEGGKP